ncbi:spore germination protein [Alicyclobacillus fastidiosus]|uniref:Spore germination protein n=1 Tax=Alicyclobacillus fastidiosus TaxID=392011 RepID=A0ABY6ZIV1_9BACL|nr:spore germination protein [Alicyclobacillus fastidiosus]WAH42041.1 spore germination protein [Alicyclobacillus fastidiosus]GMA63802.1 spore germination protein [Alicyclobacillus fastidiosus]
MFKKQKPTQRRVEPHVPDYRNAPHYDGQLNKALDYFAPSLGVSDDYTVRSINVAGRSAACLFINTICDKKVVQETLRSLHEYPYPKRTQNNLAQYLSKKVLPSVGVTFMKNLFELREAISSGHLVLMIEGVSPAIVISAKSVEHRAPERPVVESSVRGSQISFVENIDINLGLIRQGIKTATLHVKQLKVGYRSRREVAIVYIGDVANPVAVETVLKRIKAIHADVIVQGYEIEGRIVEHTWTPFPLTRTMQRVDSTIKEINQGKIAILVDGDPTIIMVPATLQDFFQTEEDFSRSFYETTFIRWLRIVSFIFALYLPALYISFVDFNPELLPKVLGIQIARSRTGVPFPAVMEVFIMQTVVEILREATLRMPKQMGQTIGIVGGLVVGEASVQAGLVSNILIIVVSLTAVSVFVSPNYEFATIVRLGSWGMIMSASFLGLYGILLTSIWLLYEVSSLKSFGISYLDPYSGEHFRDLFLDGIIQLPLRFRDKRPSHLHPQDDTGATVYQNPVPHPQLDKAYQKPNQQRRGRVR